MALSRGIRHDLAKARNIILVCGALMTIAAFFILKSVFGAQTTTIPFEIIWSDSNSSLRPTSVTVRLMDGTNEVANQTLTSANADPTDQDKWLGSFANVPYSTSYIISEDPITGYDYAVNITPTYASATITNVQNLSVSQGVNSLGDVNVIWFHATRPANDFLWTLEALDDDTLDLVVNQINAASGTSLTVAGLTATNAFGETGYGSGIQTTFTVRTSRTVRIQGAEGAIEFWASNNASTLSIDDVYYANYTIAGDTVELNNVSQIVNYTLTVHHLNTDGTEFAPDVTTTYMSGDTYTADPITAAHYEYSYDTNGPAPTGVITSDIDFTYYYQQVEFPVTYGFISPFPDNPNQLLPQTQYYHIGNTVTVEDYPTEPQGWQFIKWHFQNGDDVEPGDTFEMPADIVSIIGYWRRFNGTFSPSITADIPNESEYYRVFDTVTFRIQVTNTASYAINNVVITNSLEGSEFTTSEDYTVVSARRASIPTIPAGETVTLYATYQIPTDITQTIENTATITSATAANYYYLDNSQTYSASADFSVRSWQDDPVVTGITPNGTTLYAILLLGGAAGVVLSVVVSNNNIKERKR